ncbi:hypothetical protein COR50_06340 [Chitinophaga caeni]|uniref:ABC transporter permease n=1 Tax=Chitinophaga caeni TaxID=2029983 RepID=A0A291QS59_9BACT|nr:ABC transporter permease [Chitinophaga caeni]ATL46828.1 hypothetical protein COR50_06340 [Chitinophaga caeni]
MIRNYLKIAWRNLKRQKLYSAINIGGLALGICISVLLLWYVQDELSFNRMHSKGDQIYLVTNYFKSGDNVKYWDRSPAGIAATAVKEIPGIKQAVRIGGNYNVSSFSVGDKIFYDTKSGYVDSNFFKMFDYKLLMGEPSKPFPNNHSIIITEKTALKYFGSVAAAFNKIVMIDKDQTFTVSGIVNDFPSNSSIRYDVLFPLDILNSSYQPNSYWKSLATDFGNWNFYTFLELDKNVNTKNIDEQLTALQHRHNQYDVSSVWALQSLFDIHLYGPDGEPTALRTVRIFLIIGIIILLIGCINYVNLSTARANQRLSEIGLRKVVGATQAQLFKQFMSESLLIFIFAFAIAILGINLLLPYYNNVSGKEFSFSLLNIKLIGVMATVLLATLVIAGLYPALLLSSFNPLRSLKGKGVIGSGNAYFRKSLVVIQFFISTALIVGTLVVASQLNYIHNKDLGFNKEQVLSFYGANIAYDKMERAVAEVKNMPGVIAVTSASGNILNIGTTTGDTDWDGKPEDDGFIIHPLYTDENFIPVMGLQMAEGRNFFAGEGGSKTDIILNETAVKLMGMKDPVGKRFSLYEENGTIIGVVKDFHMTSMHNKIEPTVFVKMPASTNRLYVKIAPGKEKAVIDKLEVLWKQYNADLPFNYAFLDDTFNNMYKADTKQASLFNYFAGIAIFLSCLGLFGLVTYSTAQRYKEIGIRKALGASVVNIVGLLSKDFMKLVLIAIIIAAPIAYYAMNTWLESFAYRVKIQPWIFIAAGALSVLIAMVTLSYQSIKAALVNPVKSLRSE